MTAAAFTLCPFRSTHPLTISMALVGYTHWFKSHVTPHWQMLGYTSVLPSMPHTESCEYPEVFVAGSVVLQLPMSFVICGRNALMPFIWPLWEGSHINSLGQWCRDTLYNIGVILIQWIMHLRSKVCSFIKVIDPSGVSYKHNRYFTAPRSLLEHGSL